MPTSYSPILLPRTSTDVVVMDGDVIDDAHAIEIFLGGYSRHSEHTVRAYESETKRFLLWIKSSRQPSPTLLPLVSVDDVNKYLDFLQNPRPFHEDFLKKHGYNHQPFKGPLSSGSVKQKITILHSFFHAMRNLRGAGNQPYCLFNPVVLAHEGSRNQAQEEMEEALSPEEMQAVFAAIEDLPRETARDMAHYHRARWIFEFLQHTYMRREEAVTLKMSAFEPSPDGWTIRVHGKGGKNSKIICTEALLAELKVYRESLGLTAIPAVGESRPVIMAVTGKDKSVTAQALYLVCKVIFEMAAARLEASNQHSAARLRKASPHWMRHTGISSAMERGVSPRYVQAQARHSSLTTTSRYDHKDRKAWRQELEGKGS